MLRPIYKDLINRIDDYLLNSSIKKNYTINLEQEATPELKSVLLDEYSDHWNTIYFYKNFMYLSTHALEDQKVLTFFELSVLLNSNGRKDPMTYFPGREATYKGSKKGAAQ